MSIYHKNDGFNIIHILLFATLNLQNPALASTLKLTDNIQELKTKETTELNSEIAIIESNSFNSRKNGDSLRHQSSQLREDNYSLEDGSSQITVKPAIKNQIEENILLADISQDVFGKRSSEDDMQSEKDRAILKIVRLVSLFFFLLLFIPLGLYYPFFLFYKELLNSTSRDDEFLEEDLEPPFFAPPALEEDEIKPSEEEDEIEPDTKEEQVAFNRLQIAFYPETSNFKQQLKLIDPTNNRQGDRNIAELMQNTISLLITQQHWTHASCNSISTSILEARKKFEEVLFVEQDKKYMNRKLSLVSGKQEVPQVEIYGSTTTYKYTVVTLLFCTANGFSLSENINTKEELAEQLIKLSVISNEDLIKFELLWNPQQEGEFLSNEDLLTDYGDMVRLF